MQTSRAIEIGEHEIHVWWAGTNPSPSPEAAQRLHRILDAKERERSSRFFFEKDQTLYVCAHSLLRIMCTRYLGGPESAWRFETEPNGRPHIVEDGRALVDFNLSHTEGIVACGFTRSGRIGVDVESVCRKTDWKEVMKRVLSHEEQKSLIVLPPEEGRERFFEYWTVTEAIAKAWGIGVGVDFRKIEIDLGDRQPRLVRSPDGTAKPSLLHLTSLAHHRLAVAFTKMSDGTSCTPHKELVLMIRQFPESWDVVKPE